MILKKEILLTILFISIITLSAVSAEDNATDDAISQMADEDVIQVNDTSSDNQKHAGYWVLSGDRNNLDLEDLSKQGVTDIFINFKSYETYGKEDLESWISNASEKGINTHIWAQIFWTKKTGWVLPVVNGTSNDDFFDEKIAELTTYASLKGLSGIHMDYMRFPGSGDNVASKTPGATKAITDFVEKSTTSIRQVNPNLTVSLAIMPIYNNLERIYGIDYPTISRYFDVIIPMAYYSNFKKDRDWIRSTTQTYIANSNGALIWTGLQSYVSDNDLTHLSVAQVNGDIAAALDAGALGTIIFRYGVSENIDFKYAQNLKFNIDAKPANFIINYGGKYIITLKDSKSNPIPNEKAIFIINGKTLTSFTSSDGIAKIRLTSKLLKVGSNILTVKLSNGVTKTVKITVKKDKPKLKISKYKRKVKIALKNSKNKAIKKAKITVKFKGKIYKQYTNSKGTAIFKFKRNGKIVIKYSGNRYYKSATKKIKVKV